MDIPKIIPKFIGDQLENILQPLLRYLKLRGSLFQTEARELGSRARNGFLILLLILLGLISAYALLNLAGLALLHHLLDWPLWICAATLAGLHLLAVIIGLLTCKRLLKAAIFPESRQRLQQEKAWFQSAAKQVAPTTQHSPSRPSKDS